MPARVEWAMLRTLPRSLTSYRPSYPGTGSHRSGGVAGSLIAIMTFLEVVWSGPVAALGGAAGPLCPSLCRDPDMTSDKSYETEQRHGALVTQLGTGAYPNTDGNSYDLTRLTLVLGSNFSIVHTTPDTIFTKPVGAGVYEVKVWAVTQNVTAADAAGVPFAFTGTATGLVDYETISGTRPGGGNYTAAPTPPPQVKGQGVTRNPKLEGEPTLV